jgi:hypothetical protein
MNSKTKRWTGVLVMSLGLILLACLLPPVPKTKARASRIQSVNHVASVTFTLPITNGLPAATK